MITINSSLKSVLGGTTKTPQYKFALRVTEGSVDMIQPHTHITFNSQGQILRDGAIIHDIDTDGPLHVQAYSQDVSTCYICRAENNTDPSQSIYFFL